MEKQQIRFGQFRANSVNEENRTVDFVISTEAEDSYGTIFKADGWDLERYAKNPIVTYQHRDFSDNPDMVIGTSAVRVEENQLIATLTFEAAEDNELAEKVFRKVKSGILRGASIRADVEEYHWGNFDEGENPEVLYFTRQALLSWSVVTVPSNPDALSRNAAAMDAIRSACPKPNTADNQPPEHTENTNKTKSRFEAQISINKNLV